MKNTHVIELISNLGHVVSAIDDAMKNCEIFIQTVLYHRTSKEIYVETRVQLYKKNSSILLLPDSLSCKQAIHQANHQSYY